MKSAIFFLHWENSLPHLKNRLGSLENNDRKKVFDVGMGIENSPKTLQLVF